ncbi:ferric reductase NAD binding domain-containing protein [Mycena olivaceomarginata]|nr:ferric reductase NAD binding domain-containing protein [Mycena olivaceomarginata]
MDSSSPVRPQTVDPDRIPRIALANLYPKHVWYFMATFIALVSACHAISTLHAYLTRKRPPPNPDTPLRHGISWNRLPLATLNVFRTVTFRWSIVIAGSYTINVSDFLLAGMYLTVLFTWTFINSKNSKGVKYDPKYWANRCAHIAGSQLPLMTAFGMKNNFMSFLTGVSFDKMEHLHRVMARVICVMFWVHAFGRIVLVLSDDPTEYWFKVGVMGTSALTLLCLLSVRPLRSRSYEVFMYLHLVLGVITLVGAYQHSAEFGYGVYIWPAMFLWGLDRFFRIVRIFLVNSQLFKTHTRHVASDATVTILSPHFLRILIDTPPYFIWRPGQSAYLTISGAYPTSITEAHPFTIANLPYDDAEEGASENGSSHDETADSNREKEPHVDKGKASEDSRRLTFILRVREGFTKRLVDSVLANPNSDGVSKSFKAFVDGPYSSPPVVRGFETVVFICGGSGVSFVLPLFLDLVQAASVDANPCCQRIVLVWAIRDPDQLNWIAEAVTHALSTISSHHSTPAIDIRLHVTTAAEDTQSFEGEERSSVGTDPEAGVGTVVGTDPNPGIARAEKMDPTAKERLLAMPGVNLIYGRPGIKDILDTEIAGARGSVGINVCGTTELVQSVRHALRGGIVRFMDVLRGGPSVLLHVEGFGNT